MTGASGLGAELRLATYGTLAPGRVNAHQLAMLEGRWLTGTVKGHLKEAGWGADMGYPGLILDPDGQDVEVFLFEAQGLPDHWDRLDAFEGEGYQRVRTLVDIDGAMYPAFIYALALSK